VARHEREDQAASHSQRDESAGTGKHHTNEIAARCAERNSRTDSGQRQYTRSTLLRQLAHDGARERNALTVSRATRSDG
jgi:hypothetical protein